MKSIIVNDIRYEIEVSESADQRGYVAQAWNMEGIERVHLCYLEYEEREETAYKNAILYLKSLNSNFGKLEEEMFQVYDITKLRADFAIVFSQGAAGVARKYIQKAIRDTFNQVHYSKLHPDVVKPTTDIEWEDKWLKENL